MVNGTRQLPEKELTEVVLIIDSHSWHMSVEEDMLFPGCEGETSKLRTNSVLKSFPSGTGDGCNMRNLPDMPKA